MNVTHIVDVNKGTVTTCNKCKSNACNHNCKDGLCSNVSVETLRSLLLKTRGFIADYGVGINEENNFGYTTTTKICSKKVSKALRLIRIIEKKYVSLLRKEAVCFCDSVVDSAQERLKEVLPVSCDRYDDIKHINKDESELAIWVKSNPSCVSFEKWERALHDFKHEFTFDIQKIDCDIAYEFLVSTINCDLVADLKVIHDKSCELSYAFETNTIEECRFELSAEQYEDCKLEYQLIKEQTPSCELTLDTYVQLIECNIDKQVIANLAACNINFEVNNKEITIRTKNTSSSVNDLNFDVIEALIN